MSELAEIRRRFAQLQQQNAALDACNKQLTRDNARFLKEAQAAASQVNDLQEDDLPVGKQIKIPLSE